MVDIAIVVLLVFLGFLAGVLIGRRSPDPIGKLKINTTGNPGTPPFELHFYKDPKSMDSGTLVEFELEVK